jgi:hypothetical protein
MGTLFEIVGFIVIFALVMIGAISCVNKYINIKNKKKKDGQTN